MVGFLLAFCLVFGYKFFYVPIRDEYERTKRENHILKDRIRRERRKSRKRDRDEDFDEDFDDLED